MADSPPGSKPATTLAGPMPFRMLLDEAMQKTREHFRTLFLPFALPLAALSTAWSAGYVAWLRRFTTAVEQGNLEGTDILGSLAVGCSSLLYILIVGVAYAALWSASHEAVAGRPIIIKERWRFVFQADALTTLALAAVFSVISSLLCFFPVIYVGLMLAFILPVMLEENLWGMDAIRRSASLVRYNPRGNFLDAPMVKVFVLGAVAMVIAVGFSLPINLPVSILQNIMQFRETSSGTLGISPWLWLSVPLQTISSLSWTIVQIYLSMGVALLYFDVRRRREAGDLEAALDALTADPQE